MTDKVISFQLMPSPSRPYWLHIARGQWGWIGRCAGSHPWSGYQGGIAQTLIYYFLMTRASRKCNGNKAVLCRYSLRVARKAVLRLPKRFVVAGWYDA